MDYLDMLRDLAAEEEGEVDPTQARAVLNGAQEKLESLSSQVRDRLPEDEEAPGSSDQPDTSGKPRSEYTRQQRAEKYEEWRQEGKDPNEEWARLPK